MNLRLTETWAYYCENFQGQQQSLQPETDKRMHVYAMSQLLLENVGGEQQLLFDMQLERVRRLQIALQCQKLWHRVQARTVVLARLKEVYLKVVNPREVARLMGKVVTKRKCGPPLPPRSADGVEPYYYYLDLRSAVTTFDKPRLLGNHDLAAPYWRWVPIKHKDKMLFVNPSTGRYTYLSARQAAITIQRLARNTQVSPNSPFSCTMIDSGLAALVFEGWSFLSRRESGTCTPHSIFALCKECV